MVDLDKYVLGTPCWVELATTDIAAARAFYGDLFGWQFNEGPLPDGGVYVIPHLRDRSVAGMYEQRGDQRHAPPHWLLYVSVNDVDDTASRITALGGSLTGAPVDVMESGRMAVLQDPTGAAVALWQARKAIGSRVVNEPGAFSWAELATRDPGRAAEFYCGLFGWSADVKGDGHYTEYLDEDRVVAGMLTMDERFGDAPPHWLTYFGVSDCDGAAALVGSKGGGVDMPPSDIPNGGRVAVVSDPQGARFAVWTGTPT
ncbi:MAG: VOC family protein [Acidimicrobiia bacterium]